MSPCAATDCGHGKFSHRNHVGECQAPCCPCTWYESED